MNEVKQPKMLEIERQELKNRAKAFSEEEQKIVVGLLPNDVLTDELCRRLGTMANMIKSVREAMRVEE